MLIFLAFVFYIQYNQYPITAEKNSKFYKKYHELPRFYWEK